jgi:hypothetical protein
MFRVSDSAPRALVPLRYFAPIDARAAGRDPDDSRPLITNTFMHGGWLH